MIFKNNFQSFPLLEVYGNDKFFSKVYKMTTFFFYKHQFMYFAENSQGTVVLIYKLSLPFLLCTLCFMKRQA